MKTPSTPQSMESTASQSLRQNSGDVGWKYGVFVDPNMESCDKVMSGEVKIGSKETIDIDAMNDSFGEMKEPRSFGPMDRFTTSGDVLRKGKRKRKQEEVDDVIKKEKLTQVKKYICRWAYENAIPFDVFEHDSFKMLLEAVGQFGPRALPPTEYELRGTYLKKEVERTKNLLKRYEDEWKLNGCSIMMDARSNGKTTNIMNLCVNSKLGTVYLSSKECSNEAHTSEHICEYIESCIVQVGPENVVQIVSENASNNMEVANLLKMKRPSIFWTSCAAQTINLMLEAICGLSRYQKILDQAKKLTVFIYAHHQTLGLMRQYTKERDIVRPGVTRFASAFLTLQSLVEKKYQLRQMFVSEEWDTCKLSKTVRGKFAYATVVSPAFWSGVTTCLKVFVPLVKVLRMVAVDLKPSMGFLYGELKKAKQEIIVALSNNKKLYEPIIDIISSKMKGRLDTSLHLAAYLLNPFYLYNNLEVQDDPDADKAIVEIVDTLYPGDYVMKNQILMVELPIYKGKVGLFGRRVASIGCEANNEDFDPANWWAIYGISAPHLRKIAMRILELTTSLSGCEINWSTFEGVQTKKRNLEATKLKNLLFVQCNANLLEKNKKRKEMGHEILLASDASEAQDWIVDGDIDVDEVEPGLASETINQAMGTDEHSTPQRCARWRELFEEEFESQSEEEVDEDEVEYESDEV